MNPLKARFIPSFERVWDEVGRKQVKMDTMRLLAKHIPIVSYTALFTYFVGIRVRPARLESELSRQLQSCRACLEAMADTQLRN